jgi:hypothetical protein
MVEVRHLIQDRQRRIAHERFKRELMAMALSSALVLVTFTAIGRTIHLLASNTPAVTSQANGGGIPEGLKLTR